MPGDLQDFDTKILEVSRFSPGFYGDVKNGRANDSHVAPIHRTSAIISRRRAERKHEAPQTTPQHARVERNMSQPMARYCEGFGLRVRQVRQVFGCTSTLRAPTGGFALLMSRC